MTPELALDLFIRPACAALARAVGQPRLDTAAGHALLLRTAAVESGLEARRQAGDGPARSYWQIEPRTAIDLGAWMMGRGEAWAAVEGELFGVHDRWTEEAIARRLEVDQFAAAMLARVLYWRVPAALPIAGDLNGQAGYWKDHYNTFLGKGTPEGFIRVRNARLAGCERAQGWLG